MPVPPVGRQLLANYPVSPKPAGPGPTHCRHSTAHGWCQLNRGSLWTFRASRTIGDGACKIKLVTRQRVNRREQMAFRTRFVDKASRAGAKNSEHGLRAVDHRVDQDLDVRQLLLDRDNQI